MSSSTTWQQNEEIKIFLEYLRIPSVHPDPDYGPCVAFLRRQASNLDLPLSVHYPTGDLLKPIVVITWTGSDPKLSAILLNSHMDVVPVFEELWTRPAFGAEIDGEGRIFARGSQDMKCVGIQYLAAIRRLKASGVAQLRRTVHVSFVPDEEIGGHLGMEAFVKTAAFAELNIGFGLDEGIASPTDVYSVFYAERAVWHIRINCDGTTGHGSRFLKDTAGEKVLFILNKFFDFRALERQKLESDSTLTVGDVTTINLTMIEGGVQANVVPPLMNLTFDVRLAMDVSHERFERMIGQWCADGGPGLSYEFQYKTPWIQPTRIDDSNIFWSAFQSAVVDQLRLQIKTQVLPGGTDSRFIRMTGIPAIGFSPINNTPILLHANDEFLGADTFLAGIHIYRVLIQSLANA